MNVRHFLFFTFLGLASSCQNNAERELRYTTPSDNFPTIELNAEYNLIPSGSATISFGAAGILPDDMLGIKKEGHRIWFPIQQLTDDRYCISLPKDLISSTYDIYVLRNGCEQKLGQIRINIVEKIVLAGTELLTKPNKTISLPLYYVYTGGGTSEYDIQNNPLKLTFECANPTLASIDNCGNITGIAEGRTSISCLLPDGSLLATATVEVIHSLGSTTGITQPLTEAMIFSKKASPRFTTSVMQSFDIDRNGNIYYSQLRTNYRVYISRGKASSEYTDNMAIWYTGHGSNIAIEEEDSKIYVWAGNYGSKNTDGEYWEAQTVARIPYQPNELEIRPSDCSDNFYIGPGCKGLNPAIDTENDMLAIYSSQSYYIYRLSEAKALPMEEIELSELTYGGGSSPDMETTEKPVIFAHNLTKLTPLGVFTVPQTWKHWQGFDIADGKIYQFDGGGGLNDGTPGEAALTVFDLQGNIVEERTPIAAIADVERLASLGITRSGYMEAEGVKIHNGILYLGFASRSTDDGDNRRSNIFCYKAAL